MPRKQTRTQTRRNAQLAFVRTMVLIAGILYMLAGLSLFIQPSWFFENIGNYPPFNPHYMGDLGTFLMPLGVGLIVASQDPARHKMLIAVAVVGSLLHAMNHVRDAEGAPVSHWFTDTLPLLAFGIVFTYALWYVRPRRR